MKDQKSSLSMLLVLFVISACFVCFSAPAYSQSKSMTERECALTEGAEIIVEIIGKLIGKSVSRRKFLEWLGKVAALIAVLPGFGCSQTAKTKNRDAAEGVSPQSWKLSQRSPRVFVQDITPDRILLKNGLVVDGTANNPMTC